MNLKKICLTSIFLTAAAWFQPETYAQAQARPFQLPPNAVEIEPGAYYLGRARDRDGRVVDGIAFVHPRNAQARGGGGKPKPGSGCYSFLASGARWKSAEPYIVDSANGDLLTQTFIEQNIVDAISAWENGAGKQIFGDQDTLSIGDGADTASPDGRNEFLFGPIADPGVIAVTTAWGIFYGPPSGRSIVEWDMVCDDADFAWGDAGPTSETALGNTSLMDFLDIVTHEIGHAAGLGHPSSDCTEETMYAYAQEGETKKRTLNAGDIAGILSLYK